MIIKSILIYSLILNIISPISYVWIYNYLMKAIQLHSLILVVLIALAEVTPVAAQA